jgi:hypothetical protein
MSVLTKLSALLQVDGLTVVGDASIGGVGQELFVRRTANSSPVASSTTYASDTQLVLALAANATYMFRSLISYATPLAAGIEMRFSYSGSSSGLWTPNFLNGNTSGDTATVRRTSVNIGTGQGSQSGIDSSTYIVAEPEGIINTTTAGNLTFDWAQYVSTASNTTVGANSFIYAKRVA